MKLLNEKKRRFASTLHLTQSKRNKLNSFLNNNIASDDLSFSVHGLEAGVPRAPRSVAGPAVPEHTLTYLRRRPRVDRNTLLANFTFIAVINL